ncbi:MULTISPECIES: LysR family transcriptional regulator [Comamonadaceae]|uniref:LysR family transcriptional regulator n=1 Tax=Comamonadaceae TaxID=80864 RepID=UPI000C51E90F|nr:LysR family transcriptional regulator [Variovorax sp.]MBS80199.1 LysR family transcriptional regulator [Variovorax sp.]
MELRHLRCFIAVAEELHFARAAEKLHIEQSPLSRAIKELEQHLAVQLFERTTRRTSLTWAGKVFLDEALRIFACIDQAKASVKTAATGYHGRLRIAVSDGIAQPHISDLLAQCRMEEPEVEIRLSEVPLSQQIKGLNSDFFDAGFAQSNEVGEGITAEPVWSDALVVAVPARHPLLVHRRIPLREVLRYPLVLCHPDSCEGFWKQLKQILRTVDAKLIVADRVPSLDLMMTLVAAGYGLGFATAAHIAGARNPDVIARPLAGRSPMLTTYLLRPDSEPSEQLSRFIDRVSPLDGPAASSITQREVMP